MTKKKTTRRRSKLVDTLIASATTRGQTWDFPKAAHRDIDDIRAANATGEVFISRTTAARALRLHHDMRQAASTIARRLKDLYPDW